VRDLGVLPWSLRQRRRLLTTDQVNLAALADIDPETGHAGDRRATGIGFEAEHIRVEFACSFDLRRFGIDADGMVVDFEDTNGHVASLLKPEYSRASQGTGQSLAIADEDRVHDRNSTLIGAAGRAGSIAAFPSTLAGGVFQVNRRQFLGALTTLSCFGLGATGAAENEKKDFRVGMVGAVPPSSPGWTAFRDRLRQLGYDDKSLQTNFVQIAEDRSQQQVIRPAIERADIVVAGGPEAALKAVIDATLGIPVVVVAIDYDPVARGYAASLSHPSGQVTGVVLQQVELSPKRVGLLREAVPRLKTAALFWDALSKDQLGSAQEAAATLGIETISTEFHNPPYDYDIAMHRAVEQGAGGLVVLSSPVFFRERTRVSEAALQARLPLISPFRDMTEAGGLMSYGASIPAMYQRAAELVDKIWRGTKPADIPIEQPTSFEFAINQRTAKALDLIIPNTLLLQADVVVE
jgi:ABC-type uncharacterized transport system substrate-binding protein